MHGKIKILSSLTTSELGVDVSNLASESHQKIYVKCSTCDEIFLRDYRLIHLTHRCPIHKLVGGSMQRWCPQCSKYHVASEFNGSICSSCQDDIPSNWISSTVEHKASECSKLGIGFNLSSAQASLQWAKQGGRCFFTNLPFDTQYGLPEYPHIIRLDPSKDYTAQNIVWSCTAMDWPSKYASISEVDNFNFRAGWSCHQSPVRCECKFIHSDAKLPYRKRATDAGYDIYSVENSLVPPHGSQNISTGIIIAVPEGYYYTVEGRSGMSLYGISPFRGIIDTGYTGELKISLMNVSDRPYEVHKHDRIAQMIMHRHMHCDITKVSEFSPEYDIRGTSGFGASGR